MHALIAQSEPEQACTLIQEVLDAPQSLSSYLVIQQLRELARLLEPYQTNQAVAALCVSLHSALRQRLWLYSWLAQDDQHGSTPAEQRP